MPDLCPRTASMRADGPPQHFDISRAGRDHAQQRADGGGLARAVEAEKTIDLTNAHPQINRVHRAYRAKDFRESICFNCQGHAPSVPQICEGLTRLATSLSITKNRL